MLDIVLELCPPVKMSDKIKPLRLTFFKLANFVYSAVQITYLTAYLGLSVRADIKKAM